MSGLEVFVGLAIITGLSGLYTKLRKKVGSRYVEQKLQKLDQDIYQTLSNVKLDDQNQIDHVVLSVYGIFIIKRVNQHGTIYGSSSDQEWTCQLKKQKQTFPNPIKQHATLTSTLVKHFNIKEKYIHTIVAFANKAELAVDQQLIKANQVTDYDRLPDLIQSFSTPQLAKQQIQTIADNF
ncbi:nuclease-related domain-containing protein [Amphibacillus jilinensis]|uniref:nuclease-related domain-containing protein n=1 Tax=Amphibacillus jilinensis TaxID=1216008 RepID=UPI0003134D35|nr:nuclease-related domain-containing protein [Amphibacillus jilinensis]